MIVFHFYLFGCREGGRRGRKSMIIKTTSLFLYRCHNDNEVVYPVVMPVADWVVVSTTYLDGSTWLQEKREERREKREERREKREKRRKPISSVVPSLSRYPPHISLPEQSKGRYMRQYECSKDLHHDIKRGRRGDKRGGGEKVKEEMTHLRRSGSVSQRAPPSTSHLRCALIIYLHSKEEKTKSREAKGRYIKNKITKKYKTKYQEREEVYYRILDQQLTMWAFISSSSSSSSCFVSVPILSLCIRWPLFLIVIISMSSNVVSGKKRWGAVEWWSSGCWTIPERRENNPECSYLTWHLWRERWGSYRGALGERKESGIEGRESEGNKRG